jgi:hypothetical protein
MPLHKQRQMLLMQQSGRQQHSQTVQQPHLHAWLAAGHQHWRQQQAVCWCQGLAVLLHLTLLDQQQGSGSCLLAAVQLQQAAV